MRDREDKISDDMGNKSDDKSDDKSPEKSVNPLGQLVTQQGIPLNQEQYNQMKSNIFDVESQKEKMKDDIKDEELYNGYGVENYGINKLRDDESLGFKGDKDESDLVKDVVKNLETSNLSIGEFIRLKIGE